MTFLTAVLKADQESFTLLHIWPRRPDIYKAEKAGVNGKEPERQTVPENKRRDPFQTVETAKE